MALCSECHKWHECGTGHASFKMTQCDNCKKENVLCAICTDERVIERFKESVQAA